MRLANFVAEKRESIYESLKRDQVPPEGAYSEEALKEGKTKGAPQIGTTRYEPDAVVLEFIYPDRATTATVLSVKLKAPERIVFLPVPDWVIESIWQGDIDGSFHFESEAQDLLDEFKGKLEREKNLVFFGPRAPRRRE